MIIVCGKAHNLRAPQKPGDVGYDLVIDDYDTLEAGRFEWYRTGVYVKLPPGYYGRITGRSSSHKQGMHILEGIIDNEYTGELKVGIRNMNPDTSLSIMPGLRVAQLILCPIIVHEMVTVDRLPETIRGASGWGSTG